MDLGLAQSHRDAQDGPAAIGQDGGFKETRLSEGVELTHDQRRAFAALVLSDASYDWRIAKACMPLPGVLVVFTDGDTRSEVRICYSCVMVGFTPGSWEDFDGINHAIAWAADVFPDDEAIQALARDGISSGL